ncbi:T9SS type A sorting domain-containing protein [Salibacter sp.]|uniref:T9SS type A sorting domain-containing protein n=1 Tax=Salibacter sp. TaxID=2010995 RepID=UPI0028709FA1|nr:T9SS type A sorting domain-containing protein [Salibacter sp.]MDR9487262.1 T9SS type A sorting domain-containing protein [Salibacter sp.]
MNKTIITLLLLITVRAGFSQSADLDLTEITVPDSIEENSTVSFSAELRNNGPDSVQSGTQLTFHWSVNTDTIPANFTLDSTFYAGDSIQLFSPPFSLSPSDSLKICVSFSFQNDTVTSNNEICDSTKVYLYNNFALPENVKFIQSRSQIILQNARVSELRIYNLNGQVVTSTNGANVITTDQLKNGLYIFTARFRDSNKFYRRKVFIR